MNQLRFVRFGLIGFIGTLMQLALFSLLAKCFALIPATAIAVELTLLHNFFWHERFTWRDRPLSNSAQRAARLWRFHLSNGVVSVVGNSAITYSLAQYAHMPPLLAALAAIAICATANFLLADRWVYLTSPKPCHRDLSPHPGGQ